MDANAKRRALVGAAAALLLVGAGGALAAEKLGSPKEEHQAVINDAAKRLGIEPAKLNDALNAALKDRVDAAVAAGKLSKAEAGALKARIDSGDAPFLFGGGPHPGGPGFFHYGIAAGLDAAAKYIGITQAQLRTELQSGKSLGAVTKAHGKTVDGLVDALVAEAQKKLDAAVKAGKFTESQANDMLAELKEHLNDFVTGTAPARPFGPGGPGGFRHHGGPDLEAAASYLGMTEEQLRTELRNGKTLAEVAKGHGKTVDGLVNAVLADAKQKVDAAVKSGRLTQSQANQMLADLKDRITDLVNGRFPAPPSFGGHERGFRGFHGGGAFFGPPPAGRTA
jgi:urease accessory protein UreF